VPSGLFDAPGELGLQRVQDFSQGFFKTRNKTPGSVVTWTSPEALGVFEGADEGVAGLAGGERAGGDYGRRDEIGIELEEDVGGFGGRDHSSFFASGRGRISRGFLNPRDGQRCERPSTGRCPMPSISSAATDRARCRGEARET